MTLVFAMFDSGVPLCRGNDERCLGVVARDALRVIVFILHIFMFLL